MTIEAQPRLEPQGIPRAEADRLHAMVFEQTVGESLAMLGRDQHLEAILAGVAAARDQHAAIVGVLEPDEIHEGEGNGFREDAGDHFLGFRALQRDQRAIIGAAQFGLALRSGSDQREVILLRAGIDDDV